MHTKMGLGSHWESGLRHIHAPLKTWILFWTVPNPRTPPAIFRTTLTSRAYGLKVPPCNYVQTQTNLCLTNTLTPWQLQLKFLKNNLCSSLWLCSCCLYKLPAFFSPVEHNSNASQICVFWATVLICPK